MNIIPFRPAHAIELEHGPLKIETERPAQDLTQHYQLAADNGLSFSAIVNGWVIASAGLMPLWPGVAEAWLLASNRIDQHAIAIGRAVRTRFRQMIDAEQLHRVQAAIRSDTPSLVRLPQWLGMKHEGHMLAYDQFGADYERYALTKKDNA